MAYSITLTKGNVSKISDVLYVISVGYSVVDDAAKEVFSGSVSVKYNAKASIDDLKANILRKIKERWERRVSEESLSKSAAFDSALEEVKTLAESYINK